MGNVTEKGGSVLIMRNWKPLTNNTYRNTITGELI